MKGACNGSVLVALLVLLSAGIVCSFGLWKSSVLMLDVIRNKEIYYQHRYATEGLLLCGCRIASYNRTALIKELGKQAVVTFSYWPITDTTTGYGTVIITAKTPTEIIVRSVLYRDNQEVCALMCTVQVGASLGDNHDVLSQAILSEWSTVRS